MNLPSADKVRIDMAHVAERHIVGGAKVKDDKTVFPSS